MAVAPDADPGFRAYLARIDRFPRLDRETEHALAVQWHLHRDRASADALVQAHLRTVVKIAARYRGYGIRLADLVEEGNVGLLEGLQRFEPARNLRFMTYAAYWVRAYILAHVLKHWSIVGVGSGPIQSRLFFRLQGERARLSVRMGESEDVVGELAARLGTSAEQVLAMTQRLHGRDTSLDVRAFRDSDLTLVDVLPDGQTDVEGSTAAAERDAQVRRIVEEACRALDARERMILTERLMAEDEGATLADIGRRLGLSRERVRQLEERVKSKLRRVLTPVAQVAA